MSLLERRLQLLLSAEQHALVDREARATGRSMNAVIRGALDTYFDGTTAGDLTRRRAAFDRLLASSAADHAGPEDYETSKHLIDEELDATFPP